MPARKPPERYWRSYGSDPLPTGAEALDEPFAAFPSWLMRVTCDRCGKDRMFAETHFAQRDMQLRATGQLCCRAVRDAGSALLPPGWIPMNSTGGCARGGACRILNARSYKGPSPAL